MGRKASRCQRPNGARLSQRAVGELGVGEGQAVEIIGKCHTVAMAVGPYDEDEGLSLIRLDGLQRVNAGVSSGRA